MAENGGVYSPVRQPAYVRLGALPSQKAEYVVNFETLKGGLNTYDLNYRLDANESPEVKNLNWNDGVLSSRDGQAWVYSESHGVGYACFQDLFWDRQFFHIGTKLYCLNPKDKTPAMTELFSGVPEIRGTFFRCGETLMYKTRGAYLQIRYDAGSNSFSVAPVAAYVPTLQLNSDPATGAGDTYQPENRLCAQKKVQYNAQVIDDSVTWTGNGSVKEFSLGYTSADVLGWLKYITVGGTQISAGLYTVDFAAGKVTFTTAPASGATIVATFTVSALVYHLPVQNIDSVDTVTVDGTAKTAGTDYTVDEAAGIVTFLKKAPPITNPATQNTVTIIYSKADTAAYESIMSCRYAAVYGGNTDMCVVLGGCPAQPNAYFWSGNTSVAMDPGYFPMESYNFAGDTQEAITGFGKQQGLLVVLKERSIGKATYGVTAIDKRERITMDYVSINSRVGCDLPWTIQLVQNNIVFCNTQQGVQIVLNSSSAQENNVVGISRKINGTPNRKGLLDAARGAAADAVCSMDNDKKYLVAVGGEVWEWDYLLSAYTDPTWFYHDSIAAKAFCQSFDTLWHMDAQGRVTVFERGFMDYNKGIEKVYQFPTQHFGSYDRLKNILSVVFTLRSDTDTKIGIRWQCDYMDRDDETPITSLTYRFVPRNLSYRFLGVRRYASVERRKPGFRHVRHFTMRLSNNTVGQDMSIISAQIFYNFQGRDR